MSLLGVVDLTNGKVIEVNGFLLVGSCRRCGVCCAALKTPCVNFGYEVIDGVKLAKCDRQWTKSWQCKFWPRDPTSREEGDKTPVGCGFSWETRG